MLTLEVNRNLVENPTDIVSVDQFREASPLLTATQIQQQQLGNYIVDFLDRIDSARNKTALVDSFCKDCGQLLAQMIDTNTRIDPNHLDGLVDCAIKMLKGGMNTSAAGQFATLLTEAKSKIDLPPIDTTTRDHVLLNQGIDINPLAEMGYVDKPSPSESPAAKKFVSVFGQLPLSASR